MRQGNHTAYRLRPEKAGPVLGVLLLLWAVMLLLPFLARAAVPEAALAGDDPVELSSFDSYESYPLQFEGQQAMCEFNDMSQLMWGYDCGDVLIDSILHESSAVPDAEITLRRMVRAGSLGMADNDAPVEYYGNTLVLRDPDYGFLGILAPMGENTIMYVQLDVYYLSEDSAWYANAVWETLTGEPLPEELLGDFVDLSDTESYSGPAERAA